MRLLSYHVLKLVHWFRQTAIPRKQIIKIIKIIKKSLKLYTSTPPGTVTADMIKTKLVRVGVLSNVITFAKFEIN